MNTKQSARSWMRRQLKIVLPVFLAAPLVVTAWIVYAAYVSDNGMPVADDGSWSSEILAEVHEVIVTGSPVPVANACGLGASSCFKCHNGKRAAAPAAKIWHEQHAKVNHSCVGCHKGNERLMLKDMAHKKLIVDPRGQAQETCMNCHEKDDPEALLNKYQSVQ